MVSIEVVILSLISTVNCRLCFSSGILYHSTQIFIYRLGLSASYKLVPLTVQCTLDWSMPSWTPRCVSFLALSAQPRSRGFQSSPTSNHQLYEGKLLQTDWWRKFVLIRVGCYIMISPTHHYFAWHPESLCIVSRNQLTSTVNGENPGSRPRWSMHNLWTTPQSDNRTLLSLDNSGLSWTVAAPDKVTAVPVRRNENFQTPISVLAVRPKRCHTLSNPAHKQDYTVACLNYTLQTMMPLPGWPAMAPKCIRQQQLRLLSILAFMLLLILHSFCHLCMYLSAH